MSDDKVLIFSDDYTDPAQDAGLLQDKSRAGWVDIATLKANLDDLRPALEGVIDSLKTSGKAKGLTEVTIAVGINASGTVGFLGTSGSVGGEASLTLKFSV